MKKILFLTAVVSLLIGCNNSPVTPEQEFIGTPDSQGNFEIVYADPDKKFDIVAVSYYNYRGDKKLFQTDDNSFILKAKGGTQLIFVGIWMGKVTEIQSYIVDADVGFLY